MPIPSAPPLPADPATVVSTDGVITLTVVPSHSYIAVTVDPTALIGATSAPLTVTVTRTTADGSTVVAGLAAAVAPNGIVVGLDNQAPLGVPCTYQATVTDGTTVWTSDATAVATIPASTIGTWCNSLTDPARSIRLLVIDYPNWNRPARGNLLTVAERANPIPVSGIRGGETGTLTVYTDTPARQAAVDLLVGSDDVWLIQSPAAHNEPDRYVAVFGDVARQRVVRTAGQPHRTFPLPMVVVDRPPVDGVEIAEPGFTYDDDSGTWDDLPADRRYVDG